MTRSDAVKAMFRGAKVKHPKLNAEYLINTFSRGFVTSKGQVFNFQFDHYPHFAGGWEIYNG